VQYLKTGVSGSSRKEEEEQDFSSIY